MPETCHEKITVIMATSGKVISLLACIVNRRAFKKIIIDYRGRHLKVLQFTLPLMAFCYKTFCFTEQKCIFKLCWMVKTKTIFIFFLFCYLSVYFLSSMSLCLYYIRMCCSIMAAKCFVVQVQELPSSHYVLVQLSIFFTFSWRNPLIWSSTETKGKNA